MRWNCLAARSACTWPHPAPRQWTSPASIPLHWSGRRLSYAIRQRILGKPDAIIEKMIEGRIRKYYEEVVLLEQVWVHDGESRVKAVLKKAGATVADFARFALGEGIDKPQGPDFASEVASTAGR